MAGSFAGARPIGSARSALLPGSRGRGGDSSARSIRAAGRIGFLWPAPFVYLLITGGFPYTVVMLVLLVAWLSLKSIAQTRTIISIWPLVVGVLLGRRTFRAGLAGVT